MLTTVVTNFQRPHFLKRALLSLVAGHAPNIVVSSCGVTREVEEVHEWARKTIPGIVIVARKEDVDCNECWLAGVRACRTSYVHILHDDDVVAPDFGSVSENLIDDIDVLLMDAFFQTESPEIPSQPFMHAPVFGEPRGRIPPETLGPRLMARGGYALSPINGVMRKELAVWALEESAEAFSGPEWHVRPTMMVGNDLLLWVRSLQRARALFYDNRPLVGYGLHGGSTTVDHQATNKGGVLTAIYDRARDYVIANTVIG